MSTLFEVIRTLRERGIAVVYVSHRMEELYEICDAVTVLRDGTVVHTGRLAVLDRLHLVSLLLGREIGEVRREGLTKFAGSHDTAAEPVALAFALGEERVCHPDASRTAFRAPINR